MQHKCTYAYLRTIGLVATGDVAMRILTLILHGSFTVSQLKLLGCYVYWQFVRKLNVHCI